MKIQREHIGTSNKLRVISTNGTHGAHQGFSVEPGESYTFEIDLHRPSGMNNVINIVIWKNTGPSGAYTLHVLNTDGSNTFNYTATSSNIYIQIRQAGTYYLDNIRMYRTYQDTVFVGGFDVDMAYRYGYNTQERVPEIQKDHYTAPYWEYDPRVVHRWNRDPMAFKYPWQSPYVINNNNPIWFHDPFGLEGEEPKENELGDKKIGIDDNGNVIEYTFTYIKDKKDGYVKGWKGKINEELTQRMNANAVDVIGYRDYRTSGDLPSLEDGILTPDNAYQEANTKDMLSLTISVLAEFKGIPLVGEIISIASMDPNAPNPIGVLPLPDLSDKWDNEIQEFGKRGASKSWNLMVNYARKYNTDDNTSVIFVYAAQDIHQNLERKFPTAIVYKNAKEAEAALGFKPRVVYYKFIDNKTKNLIVPVQNKLFIP